MRYKIVIDSCGELIERWKEDPSIERASLTLTVDEEDIVDDESFDQAYFLKRVADWKIQISKNKEESDESETIKYKIDEGEDYDER